MKRRNAYSLAVLCLSLMSQAWAMDDGARLSAMQTACNKDDYQTAKNILNLNPDRSVFTEGLLFPYLKTARMAQLLNKNGVALDTRKDSFGGTIVHAACKARTTPMLLQYVVKNYCNAKKMLSVNDKRMMDDETPLHVWARWGIRDRIGRVEHLADALQKLDILCAAGVDFNVVDNQGKTPLEILSEYDQSYQSKKNVLQAYDILKRYYGIKMRMQKTQDKQDTIIEQGIESLKIEATLLIEAEAHVEGK